MDLSSAFRLLPIHPSDFSLLGIQIDNEFFIDKCMPFGCAIACATFEKFSTFLHWLISKNSQNLNIIHYLDDFLFMGAANSTECQKLSEIFKDTCEELGIPINSKKTAGPTTKLTFLGIGIDTVSQTLYVPDNKCRELQEKLSEIYQ